MGKVATLDSVVALLQDLRAAGKRVVLTNGYFDLLHVGHTRYLQRARALGDVLVVGVNVNATARRRKGLGRPILPQQERAELVAALACVDYVVIFEEDTGERLVSLLQPDIYTKGGDYTPESGAPLPEASAVQAYGGQVVILPFEAGHSTSAIIETILTRYRTARTR